MDDLTRLPGEAPSAGTLTSSGADWDHFAPGAVVAEILDPAIERAIQRCLEREPVKRPASALAVSAALPGGDPLAAALAAGETPSPEMVAAAGEQSALRPAIGVALVAFTIVMLALPAALSQRFSIVFGFYASRGDEPVFGRTLLD
jgi:hypothetical protein